MSEAFDRVSGDYAEKSLVQRKAANKLIGILGLAGDEAILDVGCGPGHLTLELRALTSGTVTGIDVSPLMIEHARGTGSGVDWRCVSAEELEYEEEFDVVFCNSTLQWFKDPDASLEAMVKALRRGGRLAVACPGTSHFSPFLEQVVSRASRRPDLASVCSRWHSPWFFLPGEGDYRELFERHSLETLYLSIDYDASDLTVEEAYGVFSSGASVAYLDPALFDGDLPAGFVDDFNREVFLQMERIAVDGRVTMDFNRMYYLGRKVRG